MNDKTLPGNHTTAADDKPVWLLQDRIEAGTLTHAELKLLSRLVGTIGNLGEDPTDNNAQAAAHWDHVRGRFGGLLAEASLITVISFGFGHPEGVPDADLVVDLRKYRDPHIKPNFRELTGRDQIVRDTVLATPGVRELIAKTVARVRADKVPGKPYVIAAGCVGGRHRGHVAAEEIATALHAELIHRDVDKPVLSRPVPTEGAK